MADTAAADTMDSSSFVVGDLFVSCQTPVMSLRLRSPNQEVTKLLAEDEEEEDKCKAEEEEKKG